MNTSFTPTLLVIVFQSIHYCFIVESIFLYICRRLYRMNHLSKLELVLKTHGSFELVRSILKHLYQDTMKILPNFFRKNRSVIYDNIFKGLNNWPSDLRSNLFAYPLHLLKQIQPKLININLSLSQRNITISIFSLKLCNEVSDVHKHSNGSKISIDCLIIILSISQNAVENLDEVFLTKRPYVIVND